MVVEKVTRVHNPRRKAGKKMSALQLKYFGGKRRKAGGVRRKKHASAKRKSNPVTALTLGVINPHRSNGGSSHMAKTRKRRKASTKRRVSRRRKNPVSHKRYTRRVHHRRRTHNPMGNVKDTATTVAGVLVGMALTKIVVGMLPSGLTGSPIMRVVATGLAAFAVGFGVGKVNHQLGAGAQLGGYAQTGSALLDVVAPSLSSTFGLKGFFGPANFVVPQSPLMPRSLPAASPAPTAMGGFANAYGRKF